MIYPFCILLCSLGSYYNLGYYIIIIFKNRLLHRKVGRGESKLNCTTHFGRGVALGMNYHYIIYTRYYAYTSRQTMLTWFGCLAHFGGHHLFRQIIRLNQYHANAVYRYDQPGIWYRYASFGRWTDFYIIITIATVVIIIL